MSAEPAPIIRLVADSSGSSRFADDQLSMTPRDFAPPAAPLDVSAAIASSAAIFWRAPVGWDGQQHPAPARQWAFVLDGEVEVEASDGTTRRLGPGGGILLEDLTGEGHTTRVIGDEPAFGVFVQVPEDRSPG